MSLQIFATFPVDQPTEHLGKRRDGGRKHPHSGSSELVSRNHQRPDSFYEDLLNISRADDYGACGVVFAGILAPTDRPQL